MKSSCLQAVRVVEKTPGATRTQFGLQIGEEPVALPGPALRGPLCSDHVDIVAEPRLVVDLPLASPRVIRWAWSQFRRFELETPTEGTEGRDVRLGMVAGALATVPRAFRPEHAPFIAGIVGHVVVGALGLPVEDAVAECVRRGLPEVEVERWVLDALEGGSFFEYDLAGRADDARRKAARDQEALREDEERARLERLGRPNASTLSERELIAIASHPRAQLPPALVALRVGGYDFVDTGFGSQKTALPMRRHDGLDYTFLPASLLMGARLPAGEVAPGVLVLAGSFIVPCTRGEMQELEELVQRTAFHKETGEWTNAARDFVRWVFDEARPALGVKPGGTREVEYDETTPEGRYRAETYEHVLDDTVLSPRSVDAALALFDLGARGLSLADDVVASILHPRLRDAWLQENPKPAHWDAREAERQRQVTEYKAVGKASPGFQAGIAGFDVDVTPRRNVIPVPYTPKAWAPPPMPKWCATEAALIDTCKAARPYFAVDEVYVSPEPRLLERAKDVIGFGDEWAPVLKEAFAAKDIVTTADIEEALRSAGKVSSSLVMPQHRRVYRIMIQLGWYKTETEIEGRRQKCWRKTAGAEKHARQP